MSLQVIMKSLADYYIYGIISISVVVVAIYVAFSVRLVLTARREEMDVCASAFIPIYNIILWVRKCLRKRKNNQVVPEDVEIEL